MRPPPPVLALSPADLAAKLVAAQKKLDAETVRLRQLSALPIDDTITTADFEAAYQRMINNVVGVTDIFYNHPQTAPDFKIKIDADIKSQIDTARLNLQVALNAWKALTNAIGTRSLTAGDLVQIQQYVQNVNNYITELKNIIDSLTPANSGLTQAQIDADRALVDGTVNNANSVVTVLDTDVHNVTQTVSVTYPDGTSTSTSTTTPITVVVNQQQTIVNQTQNTVDTIQDQINQIQASTTNNGNGTTTSQNNNAGNNNSGYYYNLYSPPPGTLDTSDAYDAPFVPPPPPDGPQLIEGANQRN